MVTPNSQQAEINLIKLEYAKHLTMAAEGLLVLAWASLAYIDAMPRPAVVALMLLGVLILAIGWAITPRQQGIEDSESQRARALLAFDRAVCLLMLTATVVLLLQQPQRITQVLLLATIGVIFARTWWTITHRD